MLKKYLAISVFVAISFYNVLAFAASEHKVTVQGSVVYENQMPLVCVELPCNDANRIKPVLGAAVVAKPLSSVGSTKTVYTDSQGKFRLKLKPGKYKLYTNFEEKIITIKKVKSLVVDFRSVVY